MPGISSLQLSSFIKRIKLLQPLSLGSYLGVDHKFLDMSHFALCHDLDLTFKSLLVDTGTYNEQMLMDKRLGHDLIALAGEVKQV
jgi:hypothetical protein